MGFGALVSLTVECGRDVGANLNGQDLYLCSNVVDFSLLWGKKCQLLRKVNLGHGLLTGMNEGAVFSVDTVKNYSFYKGVQHREIKTVRIFVLKKSGDNFEDLSGCVLSVTLHFRSIAPSTVYYIGTMGGN
jgi:hypothetical protein